MFKCIGLCCGLLMFMRLYARIYNIPFSLTSYLAETIATGEAELPLV